MQENKWADANGLGNIATGVLILSLWSLLLQKVDPISVIGTIPWVFVTFPFVLISVVTLFRNGDVVGGTINGILSGMILCQIGFRGVIVLIFYIAGKKIPEALNHGWNMIDGGAYFAAVIILVCILAISLKAGHKLSSVFLLLPISGFFCLSITSLDIINAGLFGGWCLLIFGFWLLYSGSARLLCITYGKKVLPY